jgi:dipeptidyl aminopeptidase/acylaminoacyl peptidase
MSRSFVVLLGIVLAVLMTPACVPALPGPSAGPNVNTIPAQTPTSIVSTIPALTDTPIVSTIPALTPTAAPTQPAMPTVLPAPLYFLAPSDTMQQIWRIETDGTTRRQITQEAAGVNDFDVSANDGSLAYVSGNALITADERGGNRSVLVQGPPLAPERDESYFVTEVTRPRWSPDGSRLAYGLNGVYLIEATGGTPTALLPNDPIPAPDAPMTDSVILYWPHNWSPDGKRMLIDIGYYRSEGDLGVLDLANNKLQVLSSPQGYVCCTPSWSLDNQSIYYANSMPGMIPAGMWRTDVTTGDGTTLIDGIAKDAQLLAAQVQQASDGNLYYFYGIVKAPGEPSSTTPLAMVRAASDGVTDQTQLRSDAYAIGEVVWASDGSGAVIVDAQAALESGAYPPQGPLLYLKADGSPAIPLAAEGRLLRWGK